MRTREEILEPMDIGGQATNNNLRALAEILLDLRDMIDARIPTDLAGN